MSWKLYYANPDGSQEQSVNLESLGALEGGQVTGDGLRFTFRSHKASEVMIRVPNLNPVNAPKIPFAGRVRVVDNNGVQQFAGRRVDWDASVSSERKGFTYQFQDAWWDLSKMTLKQAWWGGAYLPVTVAGNTVTLGSGYWTTNLGISVTANFYDANKNQIGSQFNVARVPGSSTQFTISGGIGASAGAKFVAFYYFFTDVVLFQYIPSDPYLSSANVVQYYITTGAQIIAILNFAIANGVWLRIGEIDPSLFVPWYPVRCLNCAEALKICLRDHPDCFTEIDYTTTPPTFNVRQRSNLTPKLLPYAYTDANGVDHQSTDIKPRPDLIPSRIGIFYRYLVNGNAVAYPQDIYPPNQPDGLLALDYSIDLQGPRVSSSFGQITSLALPSPLTAFNPANANDWWLLKHRQFLNNTSINPSTGEITNLAMCDATGNTGSPAVNVVDTNGNPINTSVFAWEMIGGGQALWMSGIQAVEATFQTWFKYTKRHVNPDGSIGATPDETVNAESVSVNVVLVNTASIQQSFYAYLTSGEGIPANLAQSIYSSLQTMQYELKQSQREEPFTSFTKPGKHCVNLNGGNPAWLNMNATVQETTYTLHMRPDGTVWATSEIACGPVEHLEAGQLVQLFNIFANRDLAKIDPWERITGQTGGGSGNGAVASTPLQNSVKSAPALQTVALTGVDPLNTSGTVRQNIAQDATTGQTHVAQVDSTNTPIANATALGMVELSNSGPPGPTTLG
ncbi:MAG: hypothetical protein KGL39_02930 [Patescibacteria group bacterium]|nr:hypothetical protein [Patescibacteria group bacterium]